MRRFEGWIIVGALALGALLLVIVLAGGSHPFGDDKQDKARAEFTDDAKAYCTLEVSSVYGDEFKNCVDSYVEDKLARWADQGRPDPATVN